MGVLVRIQFKRHISKIQQWIAIEEKVSCQINSSMSGLLQGFLLTMDGTFGAYEWGSGRLGIDQSGVSLRHNKGVTIIQSVYVGGKWKSDSASERGTVLDGNLVMGRPGNTYSGSRSGSHSGSGSGSRSGSRLKFHDNRELITR